MPSLFADEKLQECEVDTMSAGTGATQEYDDPSRMEKRKWIYSTGENVEYFSASGARWVAAFVVREVELADLSVAYDVTAFGSTAQQLQTVGLDLLRLPLSEGEPVSFYSGRDGRWLAAIMDGTQPASAVTVGYRLRLLEAERVIVPNVPAVKIRRRFPKGTRVLAFRDRQRGWRSGIVEEELNDCDDELEASDDVDVDDTRSNNTLGAPRRRKGRELAHWYMVRVRFEAVHVGEGLENLAALFGMTPSIELVPSYLLRVRHISLDPAAGGIDVRGEQSSFASLWENGPFGGW